MRIESVVFDFGGVLVWPPASENAARLAEVAGVPSSLLRERYYGDRAAFDHDTLNEAAYWERVVAGYPAARNPDMLQRLAEIDVEMWSDQNENAVQWLPILKEAGLTLGLLSNMPSSYWIRLGQRDRWLGIFEHQIISGQARVSKPDPSIYALLMDELNSGTRTFAPENVLFLDDLVANVEGARAAGIHAEVYNAFDGGLREIARKYDLPAPNESVPSDHRRRDTMYAPHRQ